MKRLQFIDLARGIGIILVIAGHMMSKDSSIHRWIYSFHMPLFFLLSGYVLQLKENSISQISSKSFIIKKIKTILWPYCSMSILTLIVYLFVYGPNEMKRLFFDFICLHGIGTLWFLIVLFAVEVLFFILYKLLLRYQYRKLLLFFVLLITFSVQFFLFKYRNIINPNTYFLIVIVNNILRIDISFIFFATGFLLSKIGILSKKYSRTQLFLFSLFCLAISFFLGKTSSVDLCYAETGNSFRFYVCALIGSVCIISISMLIEKIYYLNLLAWFGKNSLIVMATHINLYLTRLCSWIIPLSGFLGKGIAIFLVIVMECVLIFLINRYMHWLIVFPSKKQTVKH